MRFLGRLLGRVVDATTIVGAFAVALMMVHITADVVGKFLFLSPVPATIALVSHYYMVVVAFLPLAFAERSDGHITVEVVTELLPMRMQHHLGAFATLLSAIVFGLLTWRTFPEAMTKHEIGAFLIELGIKVPIWPSYYLLPIGTGLMVLVLLYKLARYVRGGEGSATSARF